jgi:hypothetical protein
MKKEIEANMVKQKIYDRIHTSYQVIQVYFREIQDREKLEEAILIELTMATDMVMNYVNTAK